MQLAKYQLSFTASALRMQDTILIATAALDEEDDELDAKIGLGKISTGRRIRREIRKRLDNLSPAQLHILLHANLDDARKIAFLAICKTYLFIREFVVEVLRDKMLRFDYQITDGEYVSFFNRKAALHPELETMSESTMSKIRQVLFRILEEAKIIDSAKNRQLQHQYLSNEIIESIVKDDKQLLEIFLMTDTDIQAQYERFNS